MSSVSDYNYLGGSNTSTTTFPTFDVYGPPYNPDISFGDIGSGTYGITPSGFDLDSVLNLDPEVAGALGNLGIDLGSELKNAYSWAKEAFPNLPESEWKKIAEQMLGTGAQLVGNNMASKSMDKLLKEYTQKIEDTSPITPEQRTRLGELGMSAAERQYFTPGHEAELFGTYSNLGSQALSQYGRLAQLYDDPMSNPVMQAVARIAGENAARKSVAPNARGLQSGSFQAEQQDALMAALGQQYANIANPMNTTLSSLYSGQQNPIRMYDTMSGADARAAQTAGNLIQAGSGTQQTLGNFITNAAFPTAVAYDPTRMAMSTMGSRSGGSSADPGDAFLGSALGAAGTAIGGPVGGAIGGLLGSLF